MTVRIRITVHRKERDSSAHKDFIHQKAKNFISIIKHVKKYDFN